MRFKSIRFIGLTATYNLEIHNFMKCKVHDFDGARIRYENY